jgi:hypothetical protein
MSPADAVFSHWSSWYICPSQDNTALCQTSRHFPITLIPSRAFNEALPRTKLHPLHLLSPYTSLSLLLEPPAHCHWPVYSLSSLTTTGHPGTGHLYKPRSFRARLTHPWWWRQYAPLKRRSTIVLHGSTSQKTILNIILAAARTWNFTTFSRFVTISNW